MIGEDHSPEADQKTSEALDALAFEYIDIGGMRLPLPKKRIVVRGNLELKEGERRRLTNDLEVRGRLIFRKGAKLYGAGWRIFTHDGITWEEGGALENADDESCEPITGD